MTNSELIGTENTSYINNQKQQYFSIFNIEKDIEEENESRQ